MNKQNIERIIEANTRWLEGTGQSADPAEYASVSASTTQLVQALQDEKETAGGTAVCQIGEIVTETFLDFANKQCSAIQVEQDIYKQIELVTAFGQSAALLKAIIPSANL